MGPQITFKDCKTSLFGYKKSEVDARAGYFRSQQDQMSEKLSNLITELTDVKDTLAETKKAYDAMQQHASLLAKDLETQNARIVDYKEQLANYEKKLAERKVFKSVQTPFRGREAVSDYDTADSKAYGYEAFKTQNTASEDDMEIIEPKAHKSVDEAFRLEDGTDSDDIQFL